MISKSMLGRTIPGDSLIHRLDARIKFVSAIIMMVATLTIRDPRILLVFSLWTLLIMLVSRIRLPLILRSVRPLIFIIVFAVLLNILTVEGRPLFVVGPLTVTEEGLIQGLMTALRLTLMVINSSLFLTLTTTPLAMADALESLLSPLRFLRFPVHEFAMMMSIALRFVPTLMDESVKIMKAQSSRGADYDTGGIFRRMNGLASILVPLFISSFRRADDLAVAMDARCYQGEKGRTRFYTSPLSAGDISFLVLVLALLGLALFAGRLLPPLSGIMGLAWGT